MGYSGAGGKLIHEKNQKQKISWHCPFNNIISCQCEKRQEEENVLNLYTVPVQCARI